MFPGLDLPSGLDVVDILFAALRNEEYRAIILGIIGGVFFTGFALGMLVCAIFVNPHYEQIAKKALENEKRNTRRR